MNVAAHPAKFSTQLHDTLVDELRGATRVVDPFGGVGTIHQLAADADVPESISIELEPEWGHAPNGNRRRIHIVGDSSAILPVLAPFDAICTSPCYGNRMADHHDARDGSPRNTYRHKLGRPLTDGSTAAMQWGDEYRSLHRYVWQSCVARLLDGGRFILNVKNHVRRSEIQPVTEWHCGALIELGLTLERVHEIPCPGNRFGANGGARVEHESVLVFCKEAT